MGIKKTIKKLLTEPVEMRLDEVQSILAYLGYELHRINGSHFQFKKGNIHLITIPVHQLKVTKYYLKLIKSIIIKAQFNF